jgi:hypothetical protein
MTIESAQTAAANEVILTEALAAQSAKTAEVMRRFNDAFLQHDPAALEVLIADDCIIEETVPAPNGGRQVGREACIKLWQGIAADKAKWFDLEHVAVAGDRATIRWRYCWGPAEADAIRGVNLMRVRDGLIVEAMGYVKGS